MSRLAHVALMAAVIGEGPTHYQERDPPITKRRQRPQGITLGLLIRTKPPYQDALIPQQKNIRVLGLFTKEGCTHIFWHQQEILTS